MIGPFWQFAMAQVVGLLTLVLCVVVIWRAVGRVPGSQEARCGACDYDVGDPIPSRCPECGAEIRAAGLVNRRVAARFGGSLVAALVAWTILSLVAGGFSFALASVFATGGGDYLTRYVDVSFSPAQFRLDDEGRPLKEYEIRFHVQATGRDGQAFDEGTIRVELKEYGAGSVRAEPAGVHASIDLLSQAYRFMDSPGVVVARGRDADIDAEAVMERLYKSFGLDVEDETIAQECAEAAHLLRMSLVDPIKFQDRYEQARRSDFGAGPDAPLIAQGWSSMSEAASPVRFFGLRGEEGVAAIVGPAGVLMYVGGLAAIVWRRRRLLSAASAGGRVGAGA